MNLRLCGGRVPIWVGGDSPWILVDFPDRETFDALYPKQTWGRSRDKYWAVLQYRREGNTLTDTAKKHGVTVQAIRQAEAKFLRLMREFYYRSKSS